jgi:predicted ATPase
MNKLIVISGCSGGGKSTLISELEKQGYSVIPEVGRRVYQERMKVKKEFTAEDYKNICEEIIAKSVIAYQHAEKIISPLADAIFFDRCFLECVSYYQSLKIKDSDKYDELVSDSRYFPTIFMTPPWKDIYCQDDERKHSFEDALAEYQLLLKYYPRFGYDLIELPKTSVQERIEFILGAVAKSK